MLKLGCDRKTDVKGFNLNLETIGTDVLDKVCESRKNMLTTIGSIAAMGLIILWGINWYFNEFEEQSAQQNYQVNQKLDVNNQTMDRLATTQESLQVDLRNKDSQIITLQSLVTDIKLVEGRLEDAQSTMADDKQTIAYLARELEKLRSELAKKEVEMEKVKYESKGFFSRIF